MKAWVAIIALLALVPAAAHGQDVEAARAAYDEAERQFHLANYQLALEGFQRSHDLLEGDARRQTVLLFNIGRALEELGRFAEAADAYRRFLRDAPQDTEMRAETRERVIELEARVRADSTRASGTAPTGDASPWIPLGGAVAGIGAAVALAAIAPGVLALERVSQLESECPSGRCGEASGPLIQEVRDLSIATDVLWISGSALAAVGLGLLLVGSSVSDDVRAEASCWVDGCRVRVGGAF